jgi:alpha-glucosidase
MSFLRYGFLLLFFPACVFANSFEVKSPDKRVTLTVKNSSTGLSYEIARDGKIIISDSSLGLAIDHDRIGGKEMQFLSKQSKRVKDNYPIVAGPQKSVVDHYQLLELEFATQSTPKKYLNIHARVYDQGVALRYELPTKNPFKEFNIQYEMTGFFFPKDYQCYGLNMGKFSNGHEGEYDPVKASLIREHNLYDHPLVCKTGDKQTTFALAESNVKNYPGSWYSGRGDGGLGVTAVLTPRFDTHPDGLNRVAVKGKLTENFVTPWRVIVLGDTPGDLTESLLVPLLGEPTKIADTRWIKSGKVAWDWWNDNQVVLQNPAIKPGMNTETYKAFIDFAATLKLEYILIDAGWHKGAAWSSTPGADITKPIPEMDMPEILRYAKENNVGVWVWLQWKQLDWQMEEGLKTYQQWGIKGIKVDFMERSDQEMLEYYHKLLNMTAKYQIMVNLHGTLPSNGMNRTYPHLLTQEGVMGAEFNKWSSRVTARHNVSIPFTRMILGPIDYTPGGFRHATPEDFPKLRRNTLPYVQTTRGQALAMYVVYDSPLQMLSDSPITYSKTDGVWPQPESEWQEGLEFIRDVPVTWDETKILQGDIGEFIITARRKGDTWYLGAMTNESARELDVKLDFLARGQYTAEIWQDGKTISTLDKKQQSVTRAQSINLSLAATGGAVVVLKKN